MTQKPSVVGQTLTVASFASVVVSEQCDRQGTDKCVPNFRKSSIILVKWLTKWFIPPVYPLLPNVNITETHIKETFTFRLLPEEFPKIIR